MKWLWRVAFPGCRGPSSTEGTKSREESHEGEGEGDDEGRDPLYHNFS